MSTGLGIDFGTTNSTVCVYDGHRFRTGLVEDGRSTLPSLLYVDREFIPYYGEAARAKFLSDNEGRKIRLESYEVGTIEITLGDNAFESFDSTGFAQGPTSYDATVSGVTDQNLPGFLFAGTKRLLGQSVVESVQVFNRRFRWEAVVSSIMGHLLRAASGSLSHDQYSAVCVGRPVNYECGDRDPQEECNDLAISRMERALGHAGITDYRFFLEPIAPVLSWIHETRRTTDGTVLVLDFGGGTLDYSIVKQHGSHLSVLGNDGYALGGDIITEQLIRDLFFPLLGLDHETISRLHEHHFDLDDLVPHIINWRTTYMLNQPAYLSKLTGAIAALPGRAHALNRARRLIVSNYSYQLFYSVDMAKQQLTETETARVRLAPVDIDLEITRTDLAHSLKHYLQTVDGSIRRFCDRFVGGTAGIDRVLLTGGTSLIPAIRHNLESMFPGRIEPVDPFMSIVKGFALGAWLSAEGRLQERDGRLEIDL
jgi:hypothetical chaperone protein